MFLDIPTVNGLVMKSQFTPEDNFGKCFRSVSLREKNGVYKRIKGLLFIFCIAIKQL